MRRQKMKTECELLSEEKCLAADLIPCDYEKEDHKQCLRYRLHLIRPQVMQLR